MNERETISTLRDQMSNLCGVFALSMMLFDRVDVAEILKLLLSAVPALGHCRAVGTYLVHDDLRPGGDSSPDLREALGALAGAEGSVEVPGATWAWAYPLRGVGGHSGYLAVSADGEPSPDEQFLVRTLAQQAGAALNSAGLFHSQRSASEQLRERNAQLAAVNDKLSHAVADLERRNRMHESLTKVAATGGAAPEIADTLRQLTGLVVVVEDKFGNLLGWAGSEPPQPSRQAPRDRTQLLDRVRRAGQPVRHRDRFISLAQPRDEVLGVLALVDPQRRAGQFELMALESAAVVLAVELAHQRSLAENELRLRGDLVDDLLTGTDDQSAIARSVALGHDLRPAHQVLVVSWDGTRDLEKLARAVDRAVTRITQARALLTRRGGSVVVVVPAEDGGAAHDWDELHRSVVAALSTADGAVGVGRLSANIADLPRSYREALRALAVRQISSRASGVTTFEDLGFYRMLGSPESNREVGEFVREWLGPLIDYDATHHYDLVQ
ncbi:MAG TPA: transcriptional regulator, partial [Pseudonocardia sp.]